MLETKHGGDERVVLFWWRKCRALWWGEVMEGKKQRDCEAGKMKDNSDEVKDTYRISCALEISDVDLGGGRLGICLSRLLCHCRGWTRERIIN